ncbi:L-carnitine dehydratase/bile acid-inducible protein F [Olavius algarvensis Delta 1 endosymbiont]|nr:L-carnitine dehydratase/bile acid-inducible protein F [Olavius algarvensis Delta 1 endosymbiont]
MENENAGPQKLDRPLDGIRIVEYGLFHAGPGANAILGDLGAEVIKIETASGDPERYWTNVAGFDLSLKNNESIIFEASNRNKTGICLDIKKKKGREIFEQLIQEADVFLTNLRASTKTKLGIDYETLAEINPQIIYAGVSGYGRRGSMNDLGAFDPLGQARSGLMFVTGTAEPAMIHLGVLDQATAITVSHAIITALLFRERKGIGQEVHVSLYSTSLWLQYFNLLVTSVLSINPCRAGDRTQHSPLRNRFCCRDGKWILGTHHPEQKYWAAFCQATGQSGLLDDPRYTGESGGPLNFVELNKIFDEVFSTRSRDEWMELLQAHGLMFCSVQQIGEVIDDPQALENNYLVPFTHPVQGTVAIPGYPVEFSKCQAGTRSAAPNLGEHTDLVLRNLGYSSNDIKQLKKDEVVT